MEIYVYDDGFRFIDTIDIMKSVIISKSFYGCGDFEIYMPLCTANVRNLQIDFYIQYGDFVGIIEEIGISDDMETGSYITVAGRGIESILERRIVWNQTIFKGTVEDFLFKIINENCINPKDGKRKIDKFVLSSKSGILDQIEIQVTGDNVLSLVTETCKVYKIGFSVKLNNEQKFEIKFYKGIDRSIAQNEKPHIIFSRDYDNLIKSDYLRDKRQYKNVALVAGEGEGVERKTIQVGDYCGLKRYEEYVDARDISSNSGEISVSEYNNQMIERGRLKLSDCGETFELNATINSLQYVFGVDYELGDIVTVQNEYGMIENVRITESIVCEDQSGMRINPVFEKR
ncbi:siphovirus ReqiPepy6 Gp37-like family protein [[Clostridium] innocuum]|nr:siphovirus ReqiPepy6 Gp37-like family protein [[Clostridium] innocuum]MCR0577404.1 siphovirus ReqiPepy6 Gp37-like family protein [[Clostridium] innocuum]